MDIICPGCHHPIVDGQHFMRVRLELATKMPDDWVPAVVIAPTVREVSVHNPGCLYQWAINDDVVEDVFYTRG